jgi:hypothetical protein
VKYYAGIGARQTPEDVLKQMTILAHDLELDGYTLRSGGAAGADYAFAKGCANKEIYKAEHYTSAAMQHAQRYHPAWEGLSEYVKQLMARNSIILLGPALIDPVDCVICWTAGGKTVGGTGQSIRIATDYDIPIFNLWKDTHDEIEEFTTRGITHF